MLSSLQKTKEKLFSIPTDHQRPAPQKVLAAAPTPDNSSSSSSALKSSSPPTKLKSIEELATAQQVSQQRAAKVARVRNIQTAMSKERAVREALEPFDFWTNVKRVNWKALISFMFVWSMFGYYVVPAVKGWKDVWTPPSKAEQDAKYEVGKQKFIEDTYKLTQKHEARKQRAERLEQLAVSTTSEGKASQRQ